LAYVVIAVLLFQVSGLLAAVVLGGVPVLALILGPALGRLQNVAASYRSQQGVLTGRIVDIIGGLTVLNGLGGKEIYASRFRQESQELQQQGYQVGRVTSLIQAAGLALPTLFLAVVVWLAARLALEGTITVGELVAVYGYAAVLVVPVSSFIEGAVDISRALVAGRRVTDFLALQREDDAGTAPVPADGDLIDTVTGVWAPAGKFTVIATARQNDAAALVDRLGGLRSGATWNSQPVIEVDPTVLREHLLVADNDADLFAGTLAAVVSGRRDVDEHEVLLALHTAAVDDLVHALPAGMASRIDSGGRNLSGGQRQRIRLARASLSNPRVLLAVDPTSAVDAATEATIVERLARARRGRTTLVTSTSALMLAEADQVHLLGGDGLIASGTHASLMRDEPAYAALVFRGEAPDAPMIDGGRSS
jgi:ABC-type bacteriocin/lantibiotic exporter with double-glycine peptidase domain